MNIISSFRVSAIAALMGLVVYSSSAQAASEDTIPVYFDGYTTNSTELAADLLNNRSLQREGFAVHSRTCNSLPCGSSRNQVWVSVSYADHLYTANVHSLYNGRLIGEQTVSSSSLPGLKVKLSQLIPDIYRSDVENPQSKPLLISGTGSTVQQSKTKSAVLIVSKRRTMFGGKKVDAQTDTDKSKDTKGGLGIFKDSASKKANDATSKKERSEKKSRKEKATKPAQQTNRKLRVLTEVGYENGWYSTQYYARVVQSNIDFSEIDTYAWQTLANQNAVALSAGLGYSFGKWDIGATGGIIQADTTIDINSFVIGQTAEATDILDERMTVQRAKAHLTRSVFSVGDASVSIGGEAAFTVFELLDIDDGTYPAFAQQGVISAGGLAKIDTNRFYISIPVGVAVDAINIPAERYSDGGVLSTTVDEEDDAYVTRRPSINPLYMGLRVGMKF